MHPLSLSSFRPHTDSPSVSATVYPLDQLSVFEATGADALTFLQGQLTNDILNAGVGQSLLAGYCTPKGRLLSTMVLGQAPELNNVPMVLGFMRRDILEPTLKRLRMFVLRSKVTLSSPDLGVMGVAIPSTQRAALVSALGHSLPETEWATHHTSTGTWICAPSAGLKTQEQEQLCRWWWIAGAEHTEACHASAVNWSVETESDWACQDIQTGLPWIESLTQDLFIPQTLNLELIGGVSFTKGCYPGQEIVARSHYRGTIKKRMALGKLTQQIESPPLPGADVFDATEPDQPCGRLINVSATQEGAVKTHWLLYEASFEAVDRKQLRAADPNGPAIETVDLPYATRPE